jgi:hypothetical protein
MKQNNSRNQPRLSATPANSEHRPYSSPLRFHLFENPRSVPLNKSRPKENRPKESRPKDTRELMVLYFGKPIDVTSEYDGKRRVLERTHLPFYQTTSSSSTNLELGWLKGTWLPCFGLSLHDHIFKLSGLKSAQGATAKWPMFLAQQKSQQNRLHQRDKKYTPLYTMDVIKFKNDKGVIIDEDTFFRIVGSRCLCWELLRISAGIGDGFWNDTPQFKEFVLSHGFDKDRRLFFPDPYFLDSVRKTRTMNTSQVYEERDDEFSLDLLRCRLVDIPEFRIVIVDGKETELVDF